MKRVLKLSAFVVAGLIVLVVVLQLIPVWALKTNPPVIAEPKWNSPETHALAKRACFDCHSNETMWPWYSNVAPVSWLVILDTVRGRNALNFSDWGASEAELSEIDNLIREGEMPPATYLLTHPNAGLTNAEKRQLIDGLSKTAGAGVGGGEGNEQQESGG